MKYNLPLITLCLLFSLFESNAQSVGDTIVVKSLNYQSGTRDTMVSFPDNPAFRYEKILMQYSMRCKNANVSTGANRNLGCGEWDYSCNTYITDSSKVDSIPSTHPSHIIGGFSGTTFDYTTQTVYNYLRFIQTKVSIISTTSETLATVGTGSLSLNNAINTDEKSSKSQYLFTASELIGAGLSTGDISGINLTALSTGNAGFLRVKLKHTVKQTLRSDSAEITGFTEVYFANSAFSLGSNRLQFNQPFNWDGTSNIIVELSTTNNSANAILDLEGEGTVNTMGLNSVNNYAINSSAGGVFTSPSSNYSSINNEITVSFWSKGNPGTATTNTTIIEGSDAAGARQLNIHLPWGNSQVYFDCGDAGSGYDRINKLATTSVLANAWSHWAFTKNAGTGSMKIYLNGQLWHSGTAKTNPIDIDTLIIGANKNLGRVFPGQFDEVRIWNKELSSNEIARWMNKPLDNGHPDYSHLVAYYPLDEGNGNVTANDVNNVASTFTSTASWNFERGNELSRLFKEVNERPNITFAQGIYVNGLLTDTVLDSVVAPSNLLTEYVVVQKTGVEDDLIQAINASFVWEAKYFYTFDGNTGVKLDSTAILATGSITPSDLDYYRRDPSKFEIMSFVTPYGINLDLGVEGKTWTFDLTDFGPILKGDKRLNLERGGQWQEEMDIKFLFILGTPPRDVFDIQQIWKVESKGYAGIISDQFFEERSIDLSPQAQHFKIRTAITGHGQEGEFIPRLHFVNINGGTKEFEWQVWKTCGENPVYPQGGTWIYDRAGWCPGMATDVQEFDIDSYVGTSQSVMVDYGLSTASGTSNYIVNNQLVSYGATNFTLDAAVDEITGPTDRVEYARFNALCANPTIVIKNTGSDVLTSLKIDYWVNDKTNKQTHVWTGSLAFGEKAQVSLPANFNLWSSIAGLENKFGVEIYEPNGGQDAYAFNNTYESNFVIPEVLPADFVLWFKSNLAPNENKIELFDANGNSIFVRNQFTANTQYRDTFNLAVGCYSLVISDNDGDGINFWANNDGNGTAFIRKVGGGIVKNFNGDFGSSRIFNFTVESPLSFDELNLTTNVKVYPNPASQQFVIEGLDLKNAKVELYNAMGQLVPLPKQVQENKIIANSSSLASGLYTLQITMGRYSRTEKLIID